MKNPWIRLYRDSLHNPKIVMLNDRQHRGWHNCLLMADDAGALPKIRDMACHMRMTIQEAEQVICELVECGLIDIEGTGPARVFKMHDWNAHQYISDSSTERVRKFRNKNNETTNETAVKRFSNDSVTPPEQSRTEADTETEAEQSRARTKKSEVSNLISGKGGRSVSDRLLRRAAGFDLPVEAFKARATSHDVEKPNGLFKKLCVDELASKLPSIPREQIKAAMDPDNDAAYGALQTLMVS